MRKKLLVKLIQDLDQEMVRLGYSNSSMKFYRGHWQMLLLFAQERGERFYSEHLGINFIEKHFHIEKIDQTLSALQIQKLRAIRILGDFQLHHTIFLRHHENGLILTKPYFIKISEQFKSYCTKKCYSKCTINQYVKRSEYFMHYLDSRKITDCKSINLILIHAYIKTLAGFTYYTVSAHICAIRVFCLFLFEEKIVQIDFAKKIPMVRARGQTNIPSVWTEDELKKLIAAIDRGSPKGKRDYAIILLACCLGMRSIDIRCLKMECFNWEDKKLVLTQSKTQTPLSLPLTQEVGWAVIDYLKYGRPKIDSPYVFLKHVAPFGPFAEAGLTQITRSYMALADIPTLKQKRGLHSLRHTMASILLEKDTSLSTISDILGHVDTNSTGVYLKIDIKKLKECSLAFGGTFDHE